MDQKNNNNKNNEIPYFWNEEELHDFFSSQSTSTQEYFHQLSADKEDDRIFEEKSHETRDFEFQNRMNRILGITK